MSYTGRSVPHSNEALRVSMIGNISQECSDSRSRREAVIGLRPHSLFCCFHTPRHFVKSCALSLHLTHPRSQDPVFLRLICPPRARVLWIAGCACAFLAAKRHRTHSRLTSARQSLRTAHRILGNTPYSLMTRSAELSRQPRNEVTQNLRS
jgi:hypothetical protein